LLHSGHVAGLFVLSPLAAAGLKARFLCTAMPERELVSTRNARLISVEILP
jgi:hypothetical protein